MTIAIVLIAVALVGGVIFVLIQRRAKAEASVLRADAADHRADAQAAKNAAALQETRAAEMAATARRHQADADQELQAATVKREVADDLNTRADSIDPDLPAAAQ